MAGQDRNVVFSVKDMRLDNLIIITKRGPELGLLLCQNEYLTRAKYLKPCESCMQFL